MKKVVALLIFTLVLSACKSEPKSEIAANTYQINVSAKGIYNGMRAYIKEFDNQGRQIIIDTAIVMNETFSFQGTVKSPSINAITVDGIRPFLPFVLESGVTTIALNKDNIKSSKIEGSMNNELLQTYQSNPKPSAQDAFDFIAAHPDADFSLLLLESLINNRNEDIKQFQKSHQLLSGVINKSEGNKAIGQKIATYIEVNKGRVDVSVGKVAPDFSAPTPDGAMLSLNDIKGKATIIDFWASWCRPCRIENPNVVKVYEKYHDKGLEIISVSLDKNNQKDRWLKAIEDDNLQWHHVSNLKFWNEPVAQMYNVRSIPATFILDENGVIVAKKLRGQALENKIEELLN